MTRKIEKINHLPTAANPYPNGQVQRAFLMPTTYQLSGTPSQEWLASYTAYDNGKNDGLVRAPVSITDAAIVGGVAMGYQPRHDGRVVRGRAGSRRQRPGHAGASGFMPGARQGPSHMNVSIQ